LEVEDLLVALFAKKPLHSSLPEVPEKLMRISHFERLRGPMKGITL
jgi:hypothetical protein